jgi:hypothetical protein
MTNKQTSPVATGETVTMRGPFHRECARCDGLDQLDHENAELKSENARLRDQLATWDPVFAIRQALPTEAEAASLLKIVTSRYPHMRESNTGEREQVQNFLCSLSDAPFMLSNDQIFLDPFRSKGTAVDRNDWRRLLSGGELRPAIPIVRKVDDRSIGFRKVLAHTW